MYTFSVDDELTAIVKQVAQRENRTIRGQFKHLLINAMKHEGLYPQNQSKSVVKSIRQEKGEV